MKLYKIYYENLVYIGMTKNSLRQRMYKHRAEAKTSDKPLYKAMRKYGPKNFRIELIEKIEDREQARIKERQLILKYGNLNIQEAYSNTTILNEIKELEIKINKLKKLLVTTSE